MPLYVLRQSSERVVFGTSLAVSIAAPADNVDHFLNLYGTATTTAPTSASGTTPIMRAAGTIVACYFFVGVTGTNGSAETGNLLIRVNNTTDTTVINNTVVWNVGSAGASHSNTGLSIQLAVNDYFTVKVDPPTWATNPTNVFYIAQVIINYAG